MQGFYNELTDPQTSLSDLAKLNDSTTTEAVRVFVSHLIEGMTPSNALWFSLDVGKESDDEKRWLSEAARIIWQNIHNSNFDGVSYECNLDGVIAGQFVMYIDEAEGGGYHFEQWPLSQCSFSSTRPNMPIDTLYRRFELTADQAMSKYGENCGQKIKEAIAKGKGDEKFTFVHVIEPRKNHIKGSPFAKAMPFSSITVCIEDKRKVNESGYHEFPCAVPRWMLAPNSQYAVGPVFDALPDAATINKIKEYELANMDLAIGGLWIAEDDGVLNPQTVTIGARKIITANSVDSMKPLQTSSDFNVGFVAEERIQNQIKKLLLADVLPPLEGQPRTATEINMRMAYVRQMLGPIFGRLQSEYLQVMIVRCFGIALRSGVLGTPPDSLNDRTWHVKYESPLARAQKLSEVTAIDQYVEGLAATSEIDPSVMDNVDLDKAARFRGEALGVPADIIPTLKDVQQRRMQREEARQEMQQEQMQNEVMLEAGKAGVKNIIGGA